jgi:hypothetical protein
MPSTIKGVTVPDVDVIFIKTLQNVDMSAPQGI